MWPGTLDHRQPRELCSTIRGIKICSAGATVRYGITWKTALLESVPPGVATWTAPLVAPACTVVMISEDETTVNIAASPLTLTLVAPATLVPRNLTRAPATPAVGTVFTNGLR